MDSLTKLAHAYIAVVDHPEEYLGEIEKGAEDRAAMVARARARQAAGTSPTLPPAHQAHLARMQAAVNQAMAAPVQPSGIQVARK